MKISCDAPQEIDGIPSRNKIKNLGIFSSLWEKSINTCDFAVWAYKKFLIHTFVEMSLKGVHGRFFSLLVGFWDLITRLKEEGN